MSRPTERTPAEVYAERRKAIDEKLERLRKVLEAFDEWHALSAADWAVVGDLNVVDSTLSAILVGCEAGETFLREGWGKKGGGR